MSKNLSEVFDTFTEEETSELLSGTRIKMNSAGSAKRILERTMALSGKALTSGNKSPVLKRKTILIIAVLAASLVALGIGSFAYAEDAKEFGEAKHFFAVNNISSEGMSRSQIKSVYNDIKNARFEESITNTVLMNNLSMNGVSIQPVEGTEANYNNRELWNMTNSFNSLLPDERLLTEHELFLWPTIGINYYQGAAAIMMSMPGIDAEIICDNAAVGKTGMTTGASCIIENVKNSRPIFIKGKHYAESIWRIEEDNVTLRILLRDNGKIVGYALVCFWGQLPDASEHPVFMNGSIVKAAMLNEEGASMTETEAQKRLDDAYDSLVKARDLFNSENDIGLMWNDWYERNSEWYWNELHPNN